MRSRLLAGALASMLIVSATAGAAPDEAQRQAIQRAMAAKAKLQQAQAAKGVERMKLMAEHMKMMDEIMGKMQAMKPRAGMSVQEREEWIRQHQSLMQQMMDQMMGEHHMMMMECAGGKAQPAEKRGEPERQK